MQRRRFIALPNDDTFHLTPKLWMALGVIASNYHLLTLEPLQILATSRDARHIPPTRAEAAARGLAVMISIEGLSPATLNAISEIARTLLTPLGLHISAHGGWQIAGRRRATRYLLVEDAGGKDQFAMPESRPHSATAKVTR
jgi:hypothetical protein